jgi:hypothetical protein
VLAGSKLRGARVVGRRTRRRPAGTIASNRAPRGRLGNSHLLPYDLADDVGKRLAPLPGGRTPKRMRAPGAVVSDSCETMSIMTEAEIAGIASWITEAGLEGGKETSPVGGLLPACGGRRPAAWGVRS